MDGTYQEAIAATERSVTTASPAKIKEFSEVNRGGTVSFSWEAKKTAGTYNCSSRVYVNGTGVGSWHETTSTSYVTVTESAIDVAVGDVITLYAYMPASGLTVYVQNFEILCDNPTVPTEVT